MTSPAALCRQPPIHMHCLNIGIYQHETTGRQNSEKAISLINAESIYVLKRCIKAKHKAIIHQSTNRLGPISIYSGLARRTRVCSLLLSNHSTICKRVRVTLTCNPRMHNSLRVCISLRRCRETQNNKVSYGLSTREYASYLCSV